MAAQGLNANVVQFNVAFNPRRGTLRGMHFQRAPHAEAKFVRCTRGAIFDVMIDLRPESPTHGRWFGTELTADNHRALYIPEGFAHGYQTLEDASEMYYFTTHVYAKESDGGIRYDDPAFQIHWPDPVTLISEKDQNWPPYQP